MIFSVILKSPLRSYAFALISAYALIGYIRFSMVHFDEDEPAIGATLVSLGFFSILPIVVAPFFWLFLRFKGYSNCGFPNAIRLASFLLGISFLLFLCIGVLVDLDDARLERAAEQQVESPTPRI